MSSKTVWVLAITFLLFDFLVGVAVFVIRPNLGSIVQALTPRPETFTELYFENHLELPKTVLVDSQNEVSFTIRNLEYKTMIYPVEVIATPENSDLKLTLMTSSITLNQGASRTMTVPFSFAEHYSLVRMKISVNLINLDQSIHFWVNIQPILTSPSPIPSATVSALPVASPFKSPLLTP